MPVPAMSTTSPSSGCAPAAVCAPTSHRTRVRWWTTSRGPPAAPAHGRAARRRAAALGLPGAALAHDRARPVRRRRRTARRLGPGARPLEGLRRRPGDPLRRLQRGSRLGAVALDARRRRCTASCTSPPVRTRRCSTRPCSAAPATTCWAHRVAVLPGEPRQTARRGSRRAGAVRLHRQAVRRGGDGQRRPGAVRPAGPAGAHDRGVLRRHADHPRHPRAGAPRWDSTVRRTCESLRYRGNGWPGEAVATGVKDGAEHTVG